MPTAFQIINLPAFERDMRRNIKRNPKLVTVIERMRSILMEDPYSKAGKYDIKKLEGIKLGEGQWRIRLGDYRLRYDIFGHEVILYSFRHRKEVY